MKTVLGLGSNSGDRLRYLREALFFLRNTVKVLEVSPLYESDALLPEGAPSGWDLPFLNLVLVCETDLGPLLLLEKLKEIEKQLGRNLRGRWAPREIDIDILLMESGTFTSESLKIPHPGLYERPFVLLPLRDLVPEWKLPLPQTSRKDELRTISVREYVQKWRSKLPGPIPFNTRRSTEHLAQLVGIVNLTPDSFSDGGLFFNSGPAIRHCSDLVQSGVGILDLGAESTRPGAEPVSPEEEWARLRPVLESLGNPVTLSIDTRNPKIAYDSLRLGANWINDVSGFQNPEMIEAVIESKADLVFMHSLTVPASRTELLPSRADPIQELLDWAQTRISELEFKGISKKRLIFDPGIGFGKTLEQTWEILRNLRKFHSLGVRILVGHSRKSFFNSLVPTPIPAHERDLETAILSAELARSGADYLRIHHPESQTRSLRLWTQIDGIMKYCL
jgi:2-amino-4-hydroxy-6-hydroxymethyldihydropteridine diphosphokinase/dihydropteroate synthase